MSLSRISLALLTLSPLVLSADGNADPITLKALGRVAFTEGPAWHAPSGNIFFTDIENNRIMRMDPSGVIHVAKTPSGRANGLLFDQQGRLHACEGHREGGNRRVTRMNRDGTLTVLTNNYNGYRYNSPNDLTMDAEGRIYFTDPRYGDREGMEIFDEAGNAVEGVSRIHLDGSVTQVLTHEIERPNGISLSADGKFLFVCDNNSEFAGNRKIWRFDRQENGDIDGASAKLLFDWGAGRGPDGMAVGPNGLLYVTAGTNFPGLPNMAAGRFPSAVYVIHPESGELVDRIDVPEDMITNCTFGGTDGDILFITAGHKLWQHKLTSEDDWMDLFDGESLTGWDGDPRLWSVQDGAITGTTTADNPTKGNTFIVWEGGEVADFELLVDYRLQAHNSGIQYRSFVLPEAADRWRLGGYQADIDFTNRYHGLLYGEKFRGILSPRGTVTRLFPGETVNERYRVGREEVELNDAAVLAEHIRLYPEWNTYRIVAEGNNFQHYINGALMTACLDQDVDQRRVSGVLGFQLHQGPPMQVQFRNIRLRKIE